MSLFRVGIVDGTPTAPVAMAQFDLDQPTRLYAAPDGGGVAWIMGSGELWFAPYGDGEPQAHRLSSPGFSLDGSRAPVFLNGP